MVKKKLVWGFLQAASTGPVSGENWIPLTTLIHVTTAVFLLNNHGQKKKGRKIMCDSLNNLFPQQGKFWSQLSYVEAHLCSVCTPPLPPGDPRVPSPLQFVVAANCKGDIEARAPALAISGPGEAGAALPDLGAEEKKHDSPVLRPWSPHLGAPLALSPITFPCFAEQG